MCYEWQRNRAAKVRGRIPGELVDGEMIVRHALKKALHGDLGDQPRHLAAQAEMLAGAKAEVTLRPAIDVVDVGIGEFPPVAVARAEGERDLVADRELLPVQFRRLHN